MTRKNGVKNRSLHFIAAVPPFLSVFSVSILPDVLDVPAFDATYRFSGGKLVGGACGEVESAGKHQRRTGGADVYLLCAAVPELINRKVFKLCPPDDGIFTDDYAVTCDRLFNRYELHLSSVVAG